MVNNTNEKNKIIENIDRLYQNNSNQNNLINEINYLINEINLNNQQINLNNQEIIARLDEIINEMITDTLEDIFGGIYIAIRIQE